METAPNMEVPAAGDTYYYDWLTWLTPNLCLFSVLPPTSPSLSASLLRTADLTFIVRLPRNIIISAQIIMG